MRRAALILSTLLVAASAVAQDETAATPPTPPDFSRETLIRFFAENPIKEPVEPRVRYGFGTIDFRAFGTRFRLGYLPIFAPLQGSQPWRNGDRWPDPFILTNTQIASPPRTWRDSRELNAELRKLEKRLRKTTIVAKPE